MLRYVVLVSLGLSAATNGLAIDFTPTTHAYTAEGVTFKELRFQDGTRQIVYEPPVGWSSRTVAGALQLTPGGDAAGDAVIQAVPLSMPQPLDEKAIAAFREQVLAGLPGGSQAAAIVSEEQNAVSIEGSVSHGITVSYQALGQTFLRNVIIANRPDMQLTFRITAPKDRFDAVQKAFRASIFSWHWVESSKG